MIRPLILAFALACATAAPALAETSATPPSVQLPSHITSLEQLVPPGWTIEAQAEGLLEDAHRPAVAMVLRQGPPLNKDERAETRARMLVVALKAPDGSYDLALQNQTLIPQLTAEQVRYMDYELGEAKDKERAGRPALEFRRGSLLVRFKASFSHGSLSDLDATFTFRLSGGRFVLVGYDSDVVTEYGGAGHWSVNFLARKISFSEGIGCVGRADAINRCHSQTEWKKLKPASLLTIEQVDDSLDFRPQMLWPGDW